MELKEFISKTITDIVRAVDEVSQNLHREVKVHNTKDSRSIEFDIAVSVEENKGKESGVTGEAEGKIKVLSLGIAGNVKGDSKSKSETKINNVSRIKFGVDVDTLTKQENIERQRQFDRNLPVDYE